MLRSFLQVRLEERVKIENIFAKTKAKGVEVITRIFKYKYAGHIIRDLDYKWNKIHIT